MVMVMMSVRRTAIIIRVVIVGRRRVVLGRMLTILLLVATGALIRWGTMIEEREEIDVVVIGQDKLLAVIA